MSTPFATDFTPNALNDAVNGLRERMVQKEKLRIAAENAKRESRIKRKRDRARGARKRKNKSKKKS